jgi:DNA-binding CsgD family transcriptional regulator
MALSDRLGPNDLRITTLLMEGRTQAEVAEKFGVSQPGISQRVLSVLRKVDFYSRHTFASHEAFEELKEAGIPDYLRDIYVTWWDAGCSQSEAARVLGQTSRLVRERLLSLHRKLHHLPKLAKYQAPLTECIATRSWGIGNFQSTPFSTIGA